MKWFSLLVAAAAFLALGLTAHADPFARRTAPPSGASYPPGYAVPVGTSVDNDFPGYPPGFSSYRGLGFMGSCCQPCSPCAQRAWDGYCDAKGNCEGTDCGEPAPCHSFFGKLHGWMYRPEWAGVPIEPVPEPAVPEAPAPRTTGEIRPNLPSPPTLDRSAWRSSPWQLPGSRSSF